MHPIQAIKAFFRVFAKGEAALSAAAPPPEDAFKASSEPAIQLLALLQKEGRLLDFLMEDVSGFSDADVGAAARRIHEDCTKVLRERAQLERVVDEEEGNAVELPDDFDRSTIALLGNVPAQGPYKGTVRHRGWRVAHLELPTVSAGSDPRIAAPAEVELS